MKILNFTLLVSILFLTASCGSSFKAISFEKTKTPLNPMSAKVNEYYTVIHLEYAGAAIAIKDNYNQQVANLTQEYQAALQRYNNATPQERIQQGLTMPQLNLPPEPVMPYLYDTQQIDNLVSIKGMQKSYTQTGLKINVYLEGFRQQNFKVDTKGTASDTTYTGTFEGSFPLRIFVEGPDNTTFTDNIAESRKFKKYTGTKYKNYNAALSDAYMLAQQKEKSAAYENIGFVNQVLDDQFGTSLARFTANLFLPSGNKHDYSDIRQANINAQMGFENLQSNPNQGYQELFQATQAWSNISQEHNSYDKKARINDNVYAGLLLNLFTVSVYTDNWEEARKYNTMLENAKMNGTIRAKFNEMRTIYMDLKKRHEIQMQNQ